MEHISALENIGRGRSCLLIGNGPSVKELLPAEMPAEMFTIGMNNTPLTCDMLVYYDSDVAAALDLKDQPPARYLVGFKTANGKVDNTCRHCTHYYTQDDRVMGDTGFHALQFADRVFRFDEMYLVGYDYKARGATYHFYEDESDKEKMARFGKWSVDVVLNMYAKEAWRGKIFNCNEGSALKAFPFKNIFSERSVS